MCDMKGTKYNYYDLTEKDNINQVQYRRRLWEVYLPDYSGFLCVQSKTVLFFHKFLCVFPVLLRTWKNRKQN
jgi:hypothetical protein